MEENELYSSATTGEGLPALPGPAGAELWGAGRRVFLPVAVPNPPASALISLSASLPGVAHGGGAACLDCQPFTLGSLPLAQAPLVGEGRAEG